MSSVLVPETQKIDMTKLGRKNAQTALQKILSENADHPALLAFKASRKKIQDYEAEVTRISGIPRALQAEETAALQALVADPCEKLLWELVEIHKKHKAARFCVDWFASCSPTTAERSKPEHAKNLLAALEFVTAELKKRAQALEKSEQESAAEAGVPFAPSMGLEGLRQQQFQFADNAMHLRGTMQIGGDLGQEWNAAAGTLNDLNYNFE